MRVSILRVAALAVSALTALADFSYQTTVKSSGPAAGTVTKQKIKGNKMRIDTGDVSVITDLDAQTVTTVRHSAKTFTVTQLNQIAAGMPKTPGEIKAEAKETGLQKKIGGFNCRQVVLTMTMQGPTGAMLMENEMWVSSEVPGAAEMRALTTRMGEKGIFPQGGDSQMNKAMVDLQRAMSKVNGVPVLQITRMKSGNDAQAKQMDAQMAAARQQMEALKKAGGEQAKMAEKMLAQLPAAGAKYLMEITMESSGFSTAAIAAGDFATPAGYKKAER